MIHRIANLDRCDLDGKWSWFTFEFFACGKRKSPVMVDMASIARRTLGAIADPHTNGNLFVGSVTAPVGFSTHATSTASGNPPEAADRKVGDC